MKFKRLAAFVLTAALSVSSVGMTAFAASLTVKDSVPLHERISTVTIRHAYGNTVEWTVGSYPESTDVTGKYELNDALKSASNYKDLSNEQLYKFVGWGTKKVSSDDEYDNYTDDAAARNYFGYVNKDGKIGKIIQDIGVSADNGTACDGNVAEYDTLILYPIYRRWASQTEKDDYDAQKAADSKANDDENRWKNRRSTQVGKLTTDITKNNVNNTTDKKIETQQISVQPQLNALTEKVVTLNRTYQPSEIKAIRDYLGVDDNDICFFYNVRYSSKYTLIPGKKAVVTLNTRDEKNSKKLNYSLRDGARVFVYRITETGKVKVSDYKQGSNFVSFVTDELGLYAMVILPKGATAMGYDNPPTGEGDVLPVAMLAVSAIGASCLLTVRKRKEIEA